MLPLSHIPFLAHGLIETLAACSFILRPSTQLSPLTPSAELILQSKGGLLLFSNLISLVFLRRPFDDTSRLVSLAFAFWHLWPCHRAIVRIRSGLVQKVAQENALGGPALHLVTHSALLVMFLASGLLS
ncbi:hypothetical protein B0I35DRAFT_478011 [Stachybotrys elegans]|uniref:Uncharacterized protein n=1 Tax=Stachybotrys elegans TaxID=80388 RepID=A0A8K0WR14_9HYPO|nr:hypothetical protein B0I35DRAFT_478011 [Stachybotrys elegans]